MSDTLGPYELVRLLGRGGMGEVYLAHDTRLQRDVALKLLPADLADDPERRGRFLREARAAAALSHPNITTILDVGEEDGRDYLAQEYLDGRPLSEIVAERTLPLAELAALAVPLADALAYAHERGVIHRDLKTANIIVTARGDPKLLDFGLAKFVQDGARREDERSTTLTQCGAVFGTPGAMSPEQALGHAVDPRSDVFSFGSLLYEAATGKPAFLGTTVQETLDKVLHAAPEPLGRLRRDLPSDFIAIVEKALRKEPGERYQSMSELAADLRHFQRRTDSGLVPPARARRPVIPVLVAGAAVVAAVAAWWFASSGGATPAATTDAPVVAVMGFENLSDPGDEAALGRMLASLVSTDLSERGGLRVVSTAKVRACLEDVKPGASERFESVAATRAARATGATVMLVGQILRQGEGVLLTAELVDVESGEARGSLREDAASTEAVFALAEDLADSVRRHLDVASPSGGGYELSRSLTDSPEAYRRYSAGELAMHQRDFTLARTFFERAVEEDPTFAMAWFRIGMAAEWSSGEGATEAFEQALAHGDRLSDRWRVTCEAAAARSRDDYDTAFALLEPVVEAGTDIPEAYNEFGETLTHSSRYRDPTRSLRCFQRALELDPTYEIVLYHIVNQLLAAGDIAGAKAVVARFTRGEQAPFGAVSVRLAERRYADAVAEAQRQLARNGNTDWEEYAVAARLLGDMELTDRVLEAWRTAEPSQPHTQDWQAAVAAELRGRFDTADRLVDDAYSSATEVFDRSIASTLRAQLAYGRGDDEAAIAAGRTVVEEDPYEFEGWFWMGLAQVRRGSLEDAARTLARGRDTLARSRAAVGPAFLDLLEAALRAAEGEPRRAREALERARALPPEVRQREFESVVAARVAEAEGDHAGALAAWREAVDPTYPWHIMAHDLDVWPLYELGRLEHEHGDPAAARDALTRFLGHWGDADRELASVADARRRLAELGGS